MCPTNVQLWRRQSSCQLFRLFGTPGPQMPISNCTFPFRRVGQGPGRINASERCDSKAEDGCQFGIQKTKTEEKHGRTVWPVWFVEEFPGFEKWLGRPVAKFLFGGANVMVWSSVILCEHQGSAWDGQDGQMDMIDKIKIYRDDWYYVRCIWCNKDLRLQEFIQCYLAEEAEAWERLTFNQSMVSSCSIAWYVWARCTIFSHFWHYDICLQGLSWRRRPELSEASPCPRRVAWLWSAQKALVRAVAGPWLVSVVSVSSDIMSHKREGNSAAAAVGRLRMAASALGPGSKQIPQLKHWNLKHWNIIFAWFQSRSKSAKCTRCATSYGCWAWNWDTKILQLRGEAVEVLHYFGDALWEAWCQTVADERLVE